MTQHGKASDSSGFATAMDPRGEPGWSEGYILDEGRIVSAEILES